MKNKLIYLLVILWWVSSCTTSNPPRKETLSSSVKSTHCADYKPRINQAVQTFDLGALENLLTTLNNQPDCPVSYLKGVKRSMAQIVAVQAEQLVQKNQLEEAEKILEQARTITWETQAVRGDIAAYRKQWQTAAKFFKQALDLSNDPQATHSTQMPTQTKIEEISQSILDAQLLAGEMIVPISSRSVEVKPMPIPVQFQFGGYTVGDITEKGKRAAQFIADYIEEQEANYVILIGHTDSKGKASYNKWLSEKRADSVKNYLRYNGGVVATIDTIGKGEEKPLPLPRWKNLTPAEIDQRNRRVEFKIVR